MNPNFLESKSAQKFECLICNFICYKKSCMTRHLSTRKHKILTNPNENKTIYAVKKAPKAPKAPKVYSCKCGKIYKHNSTLSSHKKKCNQNVTELIINNNNNDEFVFDKEFVMTILKQNAELQSQMMEQQNQILDVCKNMQPTTNVINNTNNTNNNKTFNLNLFLNEECKDAMNIMDFVDSLKIQLSDLENVGKLGFVDGISNIIVKNLKALDVNKRPVHCSDKKREIMYIKDEDKWEKENEDKNKLRKAIKHIAHKNTKILPQFKAKYPDCIHSVSNKSDQYNKIIIESMGGHGDNDKEKENKIMKKIAKEVIIEK